MKTRFVATLLPLFLCSCATLVPSRASAETLHVSVATGSDDEGEGTAEKPFASLGKAIERLRTGDTVVLRAGTYPRVRALITVQGRADAPVTIKAAPGEKVVLDGTGAAEREDDEQESKSLIPAIIDIRNSKHVVIENLEVINSGGYGIATWESEHVTVRGCKVRKTWSRGMGGNGAHLLFENNEVSEVVLQNENEELRKRSAADGKPRYWSAGAATWYRADGSLSRDVVFRGNRIHDSWGEGLIALHVDGAVLEGNEVYNTYSGLVYVDHSRNVRVNGNRVYHSTREHIRRDLQEVSPGIMFAAERYNHTPPMMPENIVITNNIISNVQVGIGFWRDPSNTDPTNRYKNIVIANNIIHDVSVIPISIQRINTDGLGDARNLIANNIIYQARYFLDSAADTGMVTLVKNPEIWDVTNNLFPNDMVGVFFKPFKSFTGNLVGDPSLPDPRVVSPLGVLRAFQPRPSSLVKGNGVALPEVTHDIRGRRRPAEKPSIGPFELTQVQ
jgi:hypothetical protein